VHRQGPVQAGTGHLGHLPCWGDAQIHFDVVSFKRCAGGSPTEVDMPADGDYVSFHCQPVSRDTQLRVCRRGLVQRNLSGYPGWWTPTAMTSRPRWQGKTLTHG